MANLVLKVSWTLEPSKISSYSFLPLEDQSHQSTPISRRIWASHLRTMSFVSTWNKSEKWRHQGFDLPFKVWVWELPTWGLMGGQLSNHFPHLFPSCSLLDPVLIPELPQKCLGWEVIGLSRFGFWWWWCLSFLGTDVYWVMTDWGNRKAICF